MTLFYSPSTRGFYDDAVHAAAHIPADAQAVEPARHAELLDAQASEAPVSIVPRETGTPVMSRQRSLTDAERRARLHAILDGETADGALMFLPSEAVYAELHANFLNVVEESYRRRVWIVSPTTLMATLNTVRAVLKDSRMREQAHVIQAEVQKMMEDVGRLDDRVGKLQTHFDQATKDIRDIRISADKITKRGDKIEDLQLSDDSPAEDLAPAQAPAQPTLRVLGSEDQ